MEPAKYPFQAYIGDEKYVFVSYAHVDDHVVYEDIAWLHSKGVRIFYDEGIPTGQKWSDFLVDRVHKADAFLVFLSPQSANSVNVQAEAHNAKTGTRPFITVFLSEVEWPTGWLGYADQYQDLKRYKHPSVEEYRHKLLGAIPTTSICQDAALSVPALVPDAPPHIPAVQPYVPPPAQDLRPSAIFPSMALDEDLDSFLLIHWENAALESLPADVAAFAGKRYADAARICNDNVKQDFTFENLRRALAANLAEAAAASSPGYKPLARAAMCLCALCHSPELWPSNIDSTVLAPRYLEKGLRLIEQIAKRCGDVSGDDSVTGGLSLADFIRAENDSARFLEDHQGVQLGTANKKRLAFGYMFAHDFGDSRGLVYRAREIPAIQGRLLFTPLFALDFLSRAGRHREIVQNPPDLPAAEDSRAPEVARIVVSSSIEVIDRFLNVHSSQADLSLCVTAAKLIRTFSAYCPPADTPTARLEGLCRRLIDQLGSQNLTAGHEQLVYEFFGKARKLIADPEPIERDFTKVMAPRLAKQADDDGDWPGVLKHLEDGERCGHGLSADELEWKFRAIYHCLMPSAEALIRMREVRGVANAKKPGSRLVSKMDRAIAEAEAIIDTLQANQTWSEAVDRYKRAPSTSGLLVVLQTVRLEAERLMTEGNPGAIVDLIAHASGECGHNPMLESLTGDLVQEWVKSGKFDLALVADLLSASSAKKQPGTEEAEVQADVVPTSADLEGDAEDGLRSTNYQSKVSVLASINLRAAELMGTEGPEATASYLHGLKLKFPDVPELVYLPMELAESWGDRFSMEKLQRFLGLIATATMSEPPEIKVKDPPPPVSPAEILSRNASSEEDRVRLRLQEYEAQCRAGEGTQ